MTKRFRWLSAQGKPDLVLFHEYFDGDTGKGLGAAHQTGWTALVTRCVESVISPVKRHERKRSIGEVMLDPCRRPAHVRCAALEAAKGINMTQLSGLYIVRGPGVWNPKVKK